MQAACVLHKNAQIAPNSSGIPKRWAVYVLLTTSRRCLRPCYQRLFWVSCRIFIMRWRLC